MTTLREIHERCKDRHWEDVDSASESGMHGTLCGECEHEWPCPDYRDAAAALAILDAAERGRHRGAIKDYPSFAVIHDPKPV